MKQEYRDILKYVNELPQWWDQNGVPRFSKFHPTGCPSIYADIVILMDISCQYCGRHFHVELHAGLYDSFRKETPPREWHYGDPPYHNCVGDSMNCEDLEVLEVWTKERPGLYDWTRISSLEVQVV